MSPLYVTANGKTTHGSIEIRDLTKSERVERGLKIGGALGAFGLLCVLVPVLHFVLPPIFILLGIVFGWSTYSTKTEVVSGRFDCPICLKPNELPKESMDFPKAFRCRQCHYDLTLNTSLVTPAGALDRS
jgi:hypothetical protein